MFVRTLLAMLVSAGLLGASPAAFAISDIALAAIQQQVTNTQIQAAYDHYGTRYGDPFSMRTTWQDLRPSGGRAASSAAMLAARNMGAIRRTRLPYRPTARTGGLAGRIPSSGTRAVSFSRITEGSGPGSNAPPPSFGNLHEGGPSYAPNFHPFQ